MAGVQDLALGGQDVDMDRARGELGLESLVINAIVLLLLLLRRRSPLVVILVRDINGDEVSVEKRYDFWIGERTRPHGESPASTTPNPHPPVVGEEEDWPLMFLREALRLPAALHPADLVEALQASARIP